MRQEDLFHRHTLVTTYRGDDVVAITCEIFHRDTNEKLVAQVLPVGPFDDWAAALRGVCYDTTHYVEKQYGHQLTMPF